MTVEYISVADCRIAYQRQVGNKNLPGILFLSGYASDMQGTKASFLAKRTEIHNISFLRFDYGGCGQSEGEFTEGTIGKWFEETLAVFDRLTEGPQIVIGSSMGGWLGLLLIKRRIERTKAFIGIAAAPDFTEDLFWNLLPQEQKENLKRDGIFYESRKDSDLRTPITLKLIEDGRNHFILRSPLVLPFPVRLLHGMEDEEVPHTTALRLAQNIECDDLRVLSIKQGNHSLSRPKDLEALWDTIAAILDERTEG